MTELRADSHNLVEEVRQARDGNPSAFERLVERTESLLKKLAYPIVGAELLADALQETYLQMFRNLSQLREPGAFIPWLSRMCLHECYRIAKKVKPEAELAESAARVDPRAEVHAKVTLEQALKRMTRDDRDILILRELLGFSYEELSFTLRCPTGTVKSRLSTARQRLKEALA